MTKEKRFTIIFLRNMLEFHYQNSSFQSKDTLAQFTELQNLIHAKTSRFEEFITRLIDYNRSIDNTAALEYYEPLFKSPKPSFIVTGQQLGLMGGPSYTILKAITAIQSAKELNAIPLFWLATEDHDIGEIDHTYLINNQCNLQRYRLKFEKRGAFVEDLTLSKNHLEVLSEFENNVGKTIFQKAPQVGDNYSLTMARELAFLFKETPLLFIEPKFLRGLAKEFFVKEIKNSQQIQDLLNQTTADLNYQGNKTPLEISSTNLFFKTDSGKRAKIKRNEQAFSIEEKILTENELLELCESYPERFSASAAARPLMQSYCIPTLAYVAGPNERLYLKQLSDYFKYHNIPEPIVIPRLSATLTSPKAEKFLQQCELKPWNVIPERWLDSILFSFNHDFYDWWKQFKALNIQTKSEMNKLLFSYNKKIVDEVLAEKQIPKEALHYLNNLLQPCRQKQERVLNWWEFQKNSSSNLIKALVEHSDWKNPSELYCRIYA